MTKNAKIQLKFNHFSSFAVNMDVIKANKNAQIQRKRTLFPTTNNQNHRLCGILKKLFKKSNGFQIINYAAMWRILLIMLNKNVLN